jgi:hypothetical protein
MATLALPPTTKAAGQDATQESLAEYVLFCLAVSSQEPIYKVSCRKSNNGSLFFFSSS